MHVSRIPARRVTLRDRALARRQDDAAMLPHLFYAAGRSGETPNNSHLLSPRSSGWCCCGWVVMLQQCQRLACGSPMAGRTSLSPAAVTCGSSREDGWSGRKPCKPPASAHPLRSFWGRWNVLFLLWPVEERLVWSQDGEVNMGSFHCEKEEKNQSCSRFFF